MYSLNSFSLIKGIENINMNPGDLLKKMKGRMDMKVCIIGGTGLLGSQSAKQLIERGHSVKAIALPPLPQGVILPQKMEITFNNYLEMTDKEIELMFSGCDGFVFVAGVDERVETTKSIYDLYRKYNIDSIERLLRIAKKCGVKHCVILGSYFSYFAKTRKELNLTKHHPYILSRIEQEKVALSFADDCFDVAILELPYIFGSQPGRKPVWVFLVESIRKMGLVTFWPKGGTAMVTVKQVGQAVCGALEKNKGGNCYPIGYYNLSWKEMFEIIHKYLGYKNRKVITIGDNLFKLVCKRIVRQKQKKGIQSGLDLVEFSKMQCSYQYIDKELGSTFLGVEEDDIDVAIGESIRLCVDILDGKIKNVVEMQAD